MSTVPVPVYVPADESDTVTAVAQDTSYVSEALGYLPSEFRPQAPTLNLPSNDPPPPYVTALTRPAMAAVVGSYALEVQACETALWGVLGETLLTAVGAGLDTIGRIVGLPRNGLPDATYRGELFVEIVVNKSNGHPDDIVRVTQQFLLLSGTPPLTFVYTENADATTPLVASASVYVSAPTGSTPLTSAQGAQLESFLRAAKSEGTRVTLLFSTANDLNTFTLDDATNPLPNANEGFGDSTNALTGGEFASGLD